VSAQLSGVVDPGIFKKRGGDSPVKVRFEGWFQLLLLFSVFKAGFYFQSALVLPYFDKSF
jgi:hypothetical protein